MKVKVSVGGCSIRDDAFLIHRSKRRNGEENLGGNLHPPSENLLALQLGNSECFWIKGSFSSDGWCWCHFWTIRLSLFCTIRHVYTRSFDRRIRKTHNCQWIKTFYITVQTSGKEWPRFFIASQSIVSCSSMLQKCSYLCDVETCFRYNPFWLGYTFSFAGHTPFS